MPALSTSVSEQIRDRFLTLDTSVDELLVHPDEAKAFALSIVGKRTSNEVTIPSVLRELIRLRKIGEERGGLPRRKRAYNGRASEKPR
jgi:hypothetical protein